MQHTNAYTLPKLNRTKLKHFEEREHNDERSPSHSQTNKLRHICLIERSNSIYSEEKSKTLPLESNMNKSCYSMHVKKPHITSSIPQVSYVGSLETLIGWQNTLRSTYNYTTVPARRHLSQLEPATLSVQHKLCRRHSNSLSFSSSKPLEGGNSFSLPPSEQKELKLSAETDVQHKYKMQERCKARKLSENKQKENALRYNKHNIVTFSRKNQVDKVNEEYKVQSLTDLFTSPFAPLEHSSVMRARLSISHTQNRLQAYRTLEYRFLPLWRQYQARKRSNAQNVMKHAMQRRSSNIELRKRQVAVTIIVKALRYSCSTFALLFRRIHSLAERIQCAMQAYHKHMEAVVEVNYRKIRRDVEEEYWRRVEEDELFRQSIQRRCQNPNLDNDNKNNINYKNHNSIKNYDVSESQEVNKLYYLAVNGVNSTLFLLIGRQPESILKNEIRRAIVTRLRNAVRRMCRARELVAMKNRKLATRLSAKQLKKNTSYLYKDITTQNALTNAKVNSFDNMCQYVNKQKGKVFHECLSTDEQQLSNKTNNKNNEYNNNYNNDNDNNGDGDDNNNNNNDNINDNINIHGHEDNNREELEQYLPFLEEELQEEEEELEEKEEEEEELQQLREEEEIHRQEQWHLPMYDRSSEHVSPSQRNNYAYNQREAFKSKTAIARLTTLNEPATVKTFTSSAAHATCLKPEKRRSQHKEFIAITDNAPIKVPVFLSKKMYSAIMDNTCYVTGKMRNDKSVSAHLFHRSHPVVSYE